MSIQTQFAHLLDAYNTNTQILQLITQKITLFQTLVETLKLLNHFITSKLLPKWLVMNGNSRLQALIKNGKIQLLILTTTSLQSSMKMSSTLLSIKDKLSLCLDLGILLSSNLTQSAHQLVALNTNIRK